MNESYNERLEYLQRKRNQILTMLKPKCEAFGIKKYDYVIDDELRESLVLEGTAIGCSCNSVIAVEEELIAYIFVTRWQRWWGYFEKATKNHVTQYWRKEQPK